MKGPAIHTRTCSIFIQLLHRYSSSPYSSSVAYSPSTSFLFRWLDGFVVPDLVDTRVGDGSRAFMCESGKGESFANFEDLFSIYFVLEHWILCRIWRSAIRRGKRLYRWNMSVTTTGSFPGSYLVRNILVKVLGVRWTLKIWLERCFGAMYIVPIDTAKPRMSLAESINRLSTTSEATYFDVLNTIR